MASKKVVEINSVLNESLNFIVDHKDDIVNIVAIIELRNGDVEYISTSTDLNFMYLAYKNLRTEMDSLSSTIYPDSDEAAQ